MATPAQTGYMDESAADHVCEFFERHLTHVGGRCDGEPFTLLDWQRDFLRELFGRKTKPNGLRIYRTAYLEIPKKNGKSTLAAGIALYMLACDLRRNAEVYTFAGTRKQASLVFDMAVRMARQSDILRDYIKLAASQKHLAIPSTDATLQAMSAEAYSVEGINASCVIFDELHTQPDRRLWDAVRYSGAARREPLHITITTAGNDKASLCYEQHDYTIKVAEGIIDDTTHLGVIYGLDHDEDWKKEDNWRRSNPSLGHTISLSDFRREAKEATNNPKSEHAFRRYRLNTWLEGGGEKLIDMTAWDGCAELPYPEGVCYAGLDLASSNDLAALVLYFPDNGSIIPYFWCPEDTAKIRERRDRVTYWRWAQDDYIEMTPGNVVDYSFIRRRINELSREYTIAEIAYDPWGALHLVQQLQDEDGVRMIEFRQGYQYINEPTNELVRLISNGKLRHGANPVLRWNASNVVTATNSSGCIRPDKQKSADKIDGVVALIMAIGRSMYGDGQTGESVYQDRGILTL